MSVENVKSVEDCKAFALNSVTKLAAAMAVKLKEMGIVSRRCVLKIRDVILKIENNALFASERRH